MASGSQGLRLGPFRGGLNTASDPTAIADYELSECVNFDFDIDGALTSRPPIAELVDGPVASQNIDLLGYFVDSAGTNWLIGSTNNAVYYLGSGTWVQITTGFRAGAMVQYDNKAWLVAVPGSASNGGSWVPTTVGSAGTFTTIASMPKGNAAAVYKDRVYIAPGQLATTNASRLTFCALADPTTWNGSDFIDINPGDGQKLIDIFVVGSNMYLFKNDSTYVFAYDSAPTKGVLSNISKVIGVSNIGCVVQYENTLYIYHEGFVYEFYNGVHQKLNIKVDFVPNFVAPVSFFRANALSIVGDRLVARYFDKIYVFNLKTRTWSTWESTFVPGRWLTEPQPSDTQDLRRYVASSAVLSSVDTYVIQDGFDASTSENMTCRMATKIFDFDTPDKFKKLAWWGIDILSTGNVKGDVVPVIYTFNVTWASLASKTWAEMTAFTWAQPGNTVPVVSQVINTAGSLSRKFLKFPKAMRFRSVYFVVELETTGTTATAPVKLFTVAPQISLRERVPKQVN